MQEFLRECAFGGHPLNCSEVATPVFDADFGKCFLIRLPSNDSRQTVAGQGLGLVIDLDKVAAYPRARKDQPLYDGAVLRIFGGWTDVVLSLNRSKNIEASTQSIDWSNNFREV